MKNIVDNVMELEHKIATQTDTSARQADTIVEQADTIAEQADTNADRHHCEANGIDCASHWKHFGDAGSGL